MPKKPAHRCSVSSGTFGTPGDHTHLRQEGVLGGMPARSRVSLRILETLQNHSVTTHCALCTWIEPCSRPMLSPRRRWRAADEQWEAHAKEIRTFVTGTAKTRQRSCALECLELFNRFGTDVGNRLLGSVRMIPPCLRNRQDMDLPRKTK